MVIYQTCGINMWTISDNNNNDDDVYLETDCFTSYLLVLLNHITSVGPLNMFEEQMKTDEFTWLVSLKQSLKSSEYI